jgi:hypothetical protein
MASSKIVTAEDFMELRCSGLNVDTGLPGIKVLRNEHLDSLRWVEVWELVWSEDNGVKFFACLYEKPATEYQSGSETEFDPREIFEVIPQEKVIIDYVPVNK